MKLRCNLDAFVFATSAFLIIIAYAWHDGIGISPDSIVYLSVARNLNAHGALIDYNQDPLVDFPAFYPLFLGAAEFVSRKDVITIAPLLNGLLFSAVILLSSAILKSFRFSSLVYRYVMLLFIVLSPVLLSIYSMLWSETLFIVILLSFILALHYYFTSRKFWALFFCAFLAGLACITRYAGVTLIGTGVMLLLFDPLLKTWRKVKHLSWFIFISILPLTLNLIHNSMVNDNLTGPRQMTFSPILGNVMLYGQELGKWMPGLSGHAVLSVFFFVGLFIALIVLFFVRCWSVKKHTTTAQIAMAFFIVYSVFIVGMSTISHFEKMNDRLLSPLYIPTLLCCSFWIPECFKRLSVRCQKYIAVFLGIIAVIFLGFEIIEFKQKFYDVNLYGIPGYTDNTWKKSDLSRFLRSRPHFFKNDYTLYSNAHEAVYFCSGLRADDLPHHVDKDYIKAFFNEDGQYLIWFNAIEDVELIDLNQILKNRKVIKQYHFKDGKIYFLLKK